MSKSSKKEQVQEIDPQMRAESEAQMELGRLIAQMGYNPYEGNDVAAFTPGQEAAFQGVDNASAAFGASTGAGSYSRPTSTVGPSGIAGHSTYNIMNQENQPSNELMSSLQQFFDAAGTPTPKQEPLNAGGGKK